MSSLTAKTDILYPEADGKPMAESDLHRAWMIRILEQLQHFFAGKKVYVSGNLLIYYVEGDPKKCVAPDAFVVKDCDPHFRRVYKVWEEKKVPHFVLETTSSSTQREDWYQKTRLYAQLGVAEYFLYDPTADWLDPPLLGFRLVGGGYVPIEPDDQDRLVSEEVSLILRLEEGQLALFKSRTGRRLLTDGERAEGAQLRTRETEPRIREAEQRIREAEQRACEVAQKLAQERAARLALEEELRQLRGEKKTETP